jgi:hypothetical protein
LNGVTGLIDINAEKSTRVKFMLFTGETISSVGLYARRSNKKKGSVPMEGKEEEL